MSSNSKHQHKHYFCLNCLQRFQGEETKNKHFKHCIDHEEVKIDMPEENSFVRFHSGQYQFRVPFVIYSDFEVTLQSSEDETELNPEAPYVREINHHIPSGFCTYVTFVYRKVGDLLRLCRVKDCMEVFCNHTAITRNSTICSFKSQWNPWNAGLEERV